MKAVIILMDDNNHEIVRCRTDNVTQHLIWQDSVKMQEELEDQIPTAPITWQQFLPGPDKVQSIEIYGTGWDLNIRGNIDEILPSPDNGDRERSGKVDPESQGREREDPKVAGNDVTTTPEMGG